MTIITHTRTYKSAYTSVDYPFVVSSHVEVASLAQLRQLRLLYTCHRAAEAAADQASAYYGGLSCGASRALFFFYLSFSMSPTCTILMVLTHAPMPLHRSLMGEEE